MLAAVLLAFPVALVALGTSSRRVVLASALISVCVFGLASAFGGVDIGPHIEIAGWILGCFYSALIMFSCGLCVVLRRDFRSVGRKHDNAS